MKPMSPFGRFDPLTEDHPAGTCPICHERVGTGQFPALVLVDETQTGMTVECEIAHERCVFGELRS